MNVVARGSSNFVVLHGGFKGYSTSNPQRSGFVSFCMLAEPGSWLATAGDGCVKSGMGDKYIRTDLHSGYFAKGDNWDSFPYYSDKSFSWVGLSRLKDGSEGDSGIELFDWDMNVAGRGKVQSVVLARGDIGGFAVLQFPDNDGKRYSQNIFYTETETVGQPGEEPGLAQPGYHGHEAVEQGQGPEIRIGQIPPVRGHEAAAHRGAV